jgi:hypothetical protein
LFTSSQLLAILSQKSFNAYYWLGVRPYHTDVRQIG